MEFGVLVFVEGGKPENSEKNSQRNSRTNNKLDRLMAPGRNPTRYIHVGERSHLCVIPAPHNVH